MVIHVCVHNIYSTQSNFISFILWGRWCNLRFSPLRTSAQETCEDAFDLQSFPLLEPAPQARYRLFSPHLSFGVVGVPKTISVSEGESKSTSFVSPLRTFFFVLLGSQGRGRTSASLFFLLSNPKCPIAK